MLDANANPRGCSEKGQDNAATVVRKLPESPATKDEHLASTWQPVRALKGVLDTSAEPRRCSEKGQDNASTVVR